VGTQKPGDLIVNHVGFGAMPLTGSAAFDLDVPSNRERPASSPVRLDQHPDLARA
jgi:predicted secreted protein